MSTDETAAVPGLFDRFEADGETFSRRLDGLRLGDQAREVFRLMAPGDWWTLPELIAAGAPGMEGAISARVRDFRKERFGSNRVERRRHPAGTPGLWQYRLICNWTGIDRTIEGRD